MIRRTCTALAHVARYWWHSIHPGWTSQPLTFRYRAIEMGGETIKLRMETVERIQCLHRIGCHHREQMEAAAAEVCRLLGTDLDSDDCVAHIAASIVFDGVEPHEALSHIHDILEARRPRRVDY